MEIKEWGANPPEYSFSSGEENRIGQHVPERYLDDRDDLKGTRLKCLSRLGALPVMGHIGEGAGTAMAKSDSHLPHV
jgi:hypothetical protein